MNGNQAKDSTVTPQYDKEDFEGQGDTQGNTDTELDLASQESVDDIFFKTALGGLPPASGDRSMRGRSSISFDNKQHLPRAPLLAQTPYTPPFARRDPSSHIAPDASSSNLNRPPVPIPVPTKNADPPSKNQSPVTSSTPDTAKDSSSSQPKGPTKGGASKTSPSSPAPKRASSGNINAALFDGMFQDTKDILSVAKSTGDVTKRMNSSVSKLADGSKTMEALATSIGKTQSQTVMEMQRLITEVTSTRDVVRDIGITKSEGQTTIAEGLEDVFAEVRRLRDDSDDREEALASHHSKSEGLFQELLKQNKEGLDDVLTEIRGLRDASEVRGKSELAHRKRMETLLEGLLKTAKENAGSYDGIIMDEVRNANDRSETLNEHFRVANNASEIQTEVLGTVAQEIRLLREAGLTTHSQSSFGYVPPPHSFPPFPTFMPFQHVSTPTVSPLHASTSSGVPARPFAHVADASPTRARAIVPSENREDEMRRVQTRGIGGRLPGQDVLPGSEALLDSGIQPKEMVVPKKRSLGDRVLDEDTADISPRPNTIRRTRSPSPPTRRSLESRMTTSRSPMPSLQERIASSSSSPSTAFARRSLPTGPRSDRRGLDGRSRGNTMEQGDQSFQSGGGGRQPPTRESARGRGMGQRGGVGALATSQTSDGVLSFSVSDHTVPTHRSEVANETVAAPSPAPPCNISSLNDKSSVSLRIASWNVHGDFSLFYLEDRYLDWEEYDIVQIQETWGVEGDDGALECPREFECFSRSRPVTHNMQAWGGVATFVRSSLKAKRRLDLEFPDCVVVELAHALFYNVYMVPHTSNWLYFSRGGIHPWEEFCGSVGRAAEMGLRLFIAGDMNGRIGLAQPGSHSSPRHSLDLTVTHRGRRLLELLQERDLIVLNGLEAPRVPTDPG